jgi:hypothetical protein
VDTPLRAFWELFATARTEVAGGIGLDSRPTPFNFANGVWGPDPDRMDEAAAWCHEHRLPPAAIVGSAHPLTRTLTVERLLVAYDVAAKPRSDGATTVVEQVGWTHTRPLAELFAYRYDRMDIEEELVRTVAGAMQRHGALDAYLAFDHRGEPAGAALAYAVDTADDHETSGGLVLIWAEGLQGHDPAEVVASRFPDRTAWRIATSDPTSDPGADAVATVARLALDR